MVVITGRCRLSGRGGDTWEQKGPRLWSCGHKGRLTHVLIEKLKLPYVPLSQMYQPVPSADLLTAGGGTQRGAQEGSQRGPRTRTMYRFKAKLVTVWISLRLRNVSEISSGHVSSSAVHEWAIILSSMRRAHLNKAFVCQKRVIGSCFRLSRGSSQLVFLSKSPI